MPKKHSPRQNDLWNHEMAMVVAKVKVTEHDGYKSYQVVEKESKCLPATTKKSNKN